MIRENRSSRREFLNFFGRSTTALTFTSLLHNNAWAKTIGQNAKRMSDHQKEKLGSVPPFAPIAASNADALSLAKGFEWKPLISWGAPINKNGETFGYNNDFLAFIPRESDGNSGLLWVNHEAPNPLFVSGWSSTQPRTKEQVSKEQLSVGGSILHIKKERSAWHVVADDPLNRRISAQTEIPFVAARPIMGATKAIGTLANCAGGVTPWKSFLTCEENYDHFYGEVSYGPKATARKVTQGKLQWEIAAAYPPEHYGWVVEVDPISGRAKKLTALGRFAHEGATVTTAKDGRCVVYMADDADDRCLYKFIAAKPGSLDEGVLFVANMDSQKWVPMTLSAHEILQKNFVDQTDVLIRSRDAAPLIGGSPLDRPEDIEIDAATGTVYVCLTNNIKKGNHFGSILKLVEKDGDPLALQFAVSTFFAGGENVGVACPDNMVFDRKGNLWFTTDVAGDKMHRAPYEKFGNNSLFYVPMTGPSAGQPFRVANAPRDAEFTGPCFAPDGRTLFLSVQHPGDETKDLKSPTSHWPGGSRSLPKPTVVTISGPALDALVMG